jgi:KRAB domain-containing zinc finger protein
LTLLNQHKRTHNQDESHGETVTVVTQNPGQLIQAQQLITESGQNLGQIQIVAAESLEPAQLHHTITEQINMGQQQIQKADKNKCITCGAHLPNNAKRKGPKLIRCENCIQNDANAQNSRPTQIFVSQDGEIKFEVNEMNQNQVIQLQGSVQQPKVAAKKKNVTTVTKCTTCNGTGVVLVTENPSAQSPVSNAQSTKMAAPTIRTVTSSASPQKIQQVQIQHIKAPPVSPPPLQVHHQVQHHAPPANQGARQSE